MNVLKIIVYFYIMVSLAYYLARFITSDKYDHAFLNYPGYEETGVTLKEWKMFTIKEKRLFYKMLKDIEDHKVE